MPGLLQNSDIIAARFCDFLSIEEGKELADWVKLHQSSDLFAPANMGGTRRTTRYDPNNTTSVFPALAVSVRQRIKDKFGFSDTKKPGFPAGIVASYAPVGDGCYTHIDPRWHENTITAHFNIVVQSPEAGGVLVIDGRPHLMRERELFCYPVSDCLHGVSVVEGTVERIMWVFGFCVTPDEWRSVLCKAYARPILESTT